MASVSVVKSASPSPVVDATPGPDVDIDPPAAKKRKLSHDRTPIDDGDGNVAVSGLSSGVISIKVR